MARPWWIALGVVLVIPALLFTLLWVFQRRLVHQPDSTPVPAAAQTLTGAVDVTLRTADGLDLGAWHLPAPAGACTVLVLPGNAGNRSGRVTLAAGLHDRGFGVLLVDYRGYGGNPGSPTEDGLKLDAEAAYRFLLDTVPQNRILVLGESIGGSPATAVALAHDPAGVLLRSPFTDLPAVARVHLPFVPGWFVRDRHPVLERVSALAGRGTVVDVVLGSGDTVVPADQSRSVAAAAAVGGGRMIEVDAGHNDPVLAAGKPLLDAVQGLSARVGC